MIWNDIIDLAFLDLQVTQPGETISTAMRTDAQSRLNTLISSLNTEGATVYTQAWFGGNLIAGITAYTLGVGGSIATASRVQKVTAWRATYGGVLSGGGPVLSLEQFAALVQQEGGEQRVIPQAVGADAAYPLINVRVSPPPSLFAAIEFHGWTAIAQIADFTLAVSLPEGWPEMLHFNLAVRLAPQYARTGGISQELAANAQNSKASIVQQNTMLSPASAPQQTGA